MNQPLMSTSTSTSTSPVRSERPDWLAGLPAAAADLASSGLPIAHLLADRSSGPPPAASTRASAVLILLGSVADRDEVGVLLTRRASGLRAHPGQVAFPGGRIDADDEGPIAAALREAAEEVGLESSTVEVIGCLPELGLAVSSSLVTPVLAWWRDPHVVSAVSADEVDEVVFVPLSELTAPAHRFSVAHPDGRRGPGFASSGLFVWGFTAILLDALVHLAGLTLEWDRRQVRDLPAGYDGQVRRR